MPDESGVSSVFSVSGRVEIRQQPPRTPPTRQTAEGSSPADKPREGGREEEEGCDDRKSRVEFEYRVASRLNKQSQEIANSIESEIKRMLAGHSGTTIQAIQAQVSFRRSCLLWDGVVVLVGWAGPIVLEAAQAVIGEVIKSAFQRAISNALDDLSAVDIGYAVDIGAMEMAVTETRRPPTSPTATRLSGALRSDVVPVWIPVLLLLVTALLLMILADRFFVISTRTQVSTAPASQAAPPSGTAPAGRQ
jgi:hypothetical protein